MRIVQQLYLTPVRFFTMRSRPEKHQMCRFVRSLGLTSLLIASIMQAVTPDPADLASAKGIVLLMVLMGNSPLEDEFDECSAEVCQPVELVKKELLPARGDKSSPGWPLALTPGQQAKIKHSVAIAFLTGLTFPGRDASLALCRLVC